MALKVRTTGLEDYAPGGGARIKMMVVGGPSAGKTRFSSFWPKPIYADCEGGLASVADRGVPYTRIRNSQDMLEFLHEMRVEAGRPSGQRQYETVVIDTLDSFQRKVKDEYLQLNPGMQSFSGFPAWGYLDAKMQMLLTRLLNLDMNVIVCVHYKDKTIREGTGENASERQELQLQLSGEIKDSVFNDFDLVGWLGVYYEAVDGQRVQKRGLTFKATPERPFLKDRLHVTPDWMEITFSDADYARLFAAVISRLDELPESQVVGEIGVHPAQPSTELGGGPVPEQAAREVPLEQFDKPTLVRMAREMGLPLRGNLLKQELIDLISKARAKPPAAAPTSAGDGSTSVGKAPAPSSASAAQTSVTTATSDRLTVQPKFEEVPDQDVPHATAIENMINGMGGVVVSDTAARETVTDTASNEGSKKAEPEGEVAQTSESSPVGKRCEVCGKVVLSEKNTNLVQVGYARYRKWLCSEHYLEEKKARREKGEQ